MGDIQKKSWKNLSGGSQLKGELTFLALKDWMRRRQIPLEVAGKVRGRFSELGEAKQYLARHGMFYMKPANAG
jgi:hypothetical protein